MTDDSGGRDRAASARPEGARLRHDLRTPVNQIVGYAEMLEEEAGDRGLRDLVPDLKRIQAAARALLPLIDRIPDQLTLREETGPRPVPPPAPAPEPPSAPGPAPAPPEVSGTASATLLVVDDNELNRDMLSRRLKSRGYTVLTADDGRQALDLVAARPFDLILLDIMMPGISGLEVLAELRRRYSVADLPVIMATARGEGEDIVQALKLGANDYVTKPLDFPVVLARTETQLSLKRAMTEIRRLADQLEIRNRFIQQTFGRYLSEEVVRRLLETPEGLRLGGEKREVTLLMADLRGFTATADRFTPEQVVRMLNNYLGTMADIITAYQGTIDEFIGDAILALFGAPETRGDDAERAAACAMAMQRAMEEVNTFNRREGLPDVQMGIAVHTGEVVVGNIGSQTRAKYGVVGSHVNLTGRIEGFTVGGQVLVSQSTIDRAGGRLTVGEKVTFEAKGFADPITVHDLLAVAGRHAIALPRRSDDLGDLSQDIPVTLTVLEGKQMTAEPFEGALVRASLTAACVRSARPLAALSSVRVRLMDGRRIRPGDLFAKVAPSAPGDGTYLIRFTSMDEEGRAALRAALG
ncbi:MAG TPA: adenylate/guanylate cyclase domain-containing protein [Vicinamibacteria bacterium]|nr:adenylate/guanylate cyclase domain-containing protein [Vicinamibacteria bacterium]